MAVRIIKDGQVVQDKPKTSLEIRLDDLEAKIALIEIFVKDIHNQLKDLKKPNVKKTNKTRTTK